MELTSGPPTEHGGLLVHRPSIGMTARQGTIRTYLNSSHSNKADLVSLSSPTLLVPFLMAYWRELLSLGTLHPPLYLLIWCLVQRKNEVSGENKRLISQIRNSRSIQCFASCGQRNKIHGTAPSHPSAAAAGE